MIPPDALFDVRMLGLVLAGVGGLTLVALFSPEGSVTRGWAERAQGVAGWAAAPWCVVAVFGGLAMLRGRRALRRAVAGRLAGAALLLLAATALHQLLTVPPVGTTPAHVLKGTPGQDGYVGLVFGAATAAWFGARGAALLMVPIAVLGFGLLCGWSLATWQRLGGYVIAAFGFVAQIGRYLIDAAIHLVTGTGRSIAAGWRAARRGATALAHQYQRWRIRRALRKAEREAARAAAAAERAAAQAALAGAVATQSAEHTEHAGHVEVSVVATEAHAPGLRPEGAAGITVGTSLAARARAPIGPKTRSRLPGIPWQLPPTSLLSAIAAQRVSQAEIDEKCRLIERTLTAFNVPVTIKEARVGPTVTQFSLRPAEGISVKQIKRYEADLQLVLAAKTLRIELPVPGRPVVGIEIPNSGIATVGLREVLEAPQFLDSKSRLRLALGRDVDGIPRVGDLARMPHLLIAGQTGSGKSGCVNSIIVSLLYQATPDELNLIMIDPKMVEMAQYEDIPHLRYPVVVDLTEAGKVLLWAVEEMERRYRVMHDAGHRHIDAYNKSLATAPRPDPSEPAPKPFPYLVLIIDELADLMMFAPYDVEPAICRLTAKARAVGIHLVVATQRPSVDVVTGLIKANMPSRIAFAVSSQIDSRVILDQPGAESLLGRGDMLYLPFDQGKPVRVQGTWVTDEEIPKLVHFWKKQGSPQYVQKEEIDALLLKQEEAEKGSDKQSPLLDRAMVLLQTTNYTSVSFLQRKLGIGYPRAARLLDELEHRGLVEAEEGNGRSYRVVATALPGAVDVESE
ncbi:MAG: DNA translocase FtsK [Chloroflexi bacterium]|nr:DNA translocase FtsK [Chloroflexota bacterium]